MRRKIEREAVRGLELDILKSLLQLSLPRQLKLHHISGRILFRVHQVFLAPRFTNARGCDGDGRLWPGERLIE